MEKEKEIWNKGDRPTFFKQGTAGSVAKLNKAYQQTQSALHYIKKLRQSRKL